MIITHVNVLPSLLYRTAAYRSVHDLIFVPSNCGESHLHLLGLYTFVLSSCAVTYFHRLRHMIFVLSNCVELVYFPHYTQPLPSSVMVINTIPTHSEKFSWNLTVWGGGEFLPESLEKEPWIVFTNISSLTTLKRR